MVLESILRPKKAEDKPIEIFIIAVLFSAIATWLALNLFPTQASILSVAFITIFFTPFFQRLFVFEEKKDEIAARKHKKAGNFIMRHRKIVYAYSAFFFGIILTYTFIFVFSPESSNVFSLQMDWFRSQGITSASAADIAGNQALAGTFERYFVNNSQVMILFFILSVLFGAGAVFILAWNASVIAVFLGVIVNKLAPTLGQSTAFVYGVSAGLGSIALHGIPEILGYFFAGVAGGILSVGLLREQFMSPEFNEVLKDSLMWLILGEMLILIGAVLEAAV